MTAVLARLSAALNDRYRLDRELGAGGMATVYLAHDIKHDRDVAIKVLHADLGAALGGERFLSEIRTTARLQHPHILPLLDSGDADGLLYYVMPLVTGETLRARLDRERQLPIADAIRIAREVASALDYAHRQNVIHRDVKPENILLHDGSALVADFGIALAVQSAGGQRMTQTGLSLGTPQYMSPEQAMGERTIDTRSDIYALGAVTYEMLVGEAPFTGPSVQAIVARVLTEEPRGIALQRKAVPEAVENAVMRALEKVPADRFASAAEFVTALRDGATGQRAVASRRAPRASVSIWQVIAAGAAMLVLGVSAGWFALQRSSAVEATRAFSIVLPDSARVAFQGGLESPGGHGSVAISPDGRRIAWVATAPRGVRLAVRDADAYTVRVLPGTDGAFAPFFSIDGTTIGYFSGSELRTLSLATGESRVVQRDIKEPNGAAFLSDGRIVYMTQYLGGFIASSSGVTQSIAKPVVNSDGSVESFAFPAVVPGDRYLLGVERGLNYFVAAVDLKSGVFRRFQRFGTNESREPETRFVRGSAPRLVGDRLVWLDGDVLMTATVDVAAARLTSEPSSVVTGVRGDLNGAADFALATDGTIAFVPGGDPSIGKLAWLDRNGQIDTLPIPESNYMGWDISPDGKRVVTMTSPKLGQREFRVLDLARGINTKLAISAPFSSQPVWTADGRSLMLSVKQTPADAGAVVRISADGGSNIDTLLRGFASRYARSRDGRVVIANMQGQQSLTGLAVSVNGKPFTMLDRLKNVKTPAVTPDGRWLAYDEEVGHAEVFVERFPSDGRRYQVSPDGGYEAIFAASGDRLFYRFGRSIMSVAFTPGDPPTIGKPAVYVTYDFADFPGRAWMLAPDGRFLIKLLPSVVPRSEIRVLTGALSPARPGAASVGAR